MSFVAFKNNHWLFMASFFVFFVVCNYAFYFVSGHVLGPDGNMSSALEIGSEIVLSLFLAGIVKYIVEKYIQKRKVSFLLLK